MDRKSTPPPPARSPDQQSWRHSAGGADLTGLRPGSLRDNWSGIVQCSLLQFYFKRH